MEFPPWLEFRLENGRARPSPGNPSLHARNRNDSRSRDEIVSSLFRGAGRGAVHVNNSRSPCERVSFSTEQRASNSSFFLPTGKWYCSPLLASIVTPNFSWIGGIIGSNRWISSEMFRALIEYYYTLRNALILDLSLLFDRKILKGSRIRYIWMKYERFERALVWKMLYLYIFLLGEWLKIKNIFNKGKRNKLCYKLCALIWILLYSPPLRSALLIFSLLFDRKILKGSRIIWVKYKHFERVLAWKVLYLCIFLLENDWK